MTGNSCPGLKSAIETLTAYELLARQYKLKSKQEALSSIQQSYYKQCGGGGGTVTTGSFATYKMKTPSGITVEETVPTFIYSSFFMDDDVKQIYLESLDESSKTLYGEWKTAHADLSLAIQKDATELKNKQFTKQFQEAAKNIKWDQYKLDNTKVKELNKDMLEKLSEGKRK